MRSHAGRPLQSRILYFPEHEGLSIGLSFGRSGVSGLIETRERGICAARAGHCGGPSRILFGPRRDVCQSRSAAITSIVNAILESLSTPRLYFVAPGDMPTNPMRDHRQKKRRSKSKLSHAWAARRTAIQMITHWILFG